VFALPYPVYMRTRIAIVIASALILLAGGAAIALALLSSTSSTASRPAIEEDDDFGTVEVYAVLEDGSLDPAATGLAAEVWETFERVATPDFTADVMAEYRVGDAPDSDTLAYVYQTSDPEYWVLAANLATSRDTEQLIATLIHEYAHILTLGTNQVDPAAGSCSTLDLDEGCADPDSLLQAFQATFWSGYGDAPDAANSDPDVAYEFYLAHEEDFVSDYAATNVVEDIAESFMTFVLEDEPAAGTVTAAKLLFFWYEPDLVAIRERIRAEFADELGLAG
jgi:hypothetical protein